jgi:hypothetical protein
MLSGFILIYYNYTLILLSRSFKINIINNHKIFKLIQKKILIPILIMHKYQEI